ncbi:MAG: hypothetical protein OXF11_04205 [Deltaproteobacteria bacterium]|nr:hypothetical protein [Deltaproteobacteria bacterium]
MSRAVLLFCAVLLAAAAGHEVEKTTMPAKPAKKPKPEHRPMPEDPRELARAMFRAADAKIEKKKTATGKKSAA